ncbi:MAG TPA: dihydrofolate reductase family protein [Polyangiaceae bacterium]
MGEVIYWLSVSVDGYVETRDKQIDWSAPSEGLHRFFNDTARVAGMFLMGRRTYDMMAAFWPTADQVPGASDLIKEYAGIWREKPKAVFSRSPREVAWSSRLVTGDVAAEVNALKRRVEGEMWLAGPNLAATFAELGLIDEYRLFVRPIVLGGGTPFFPPMDARLRLRLAEAPRTFPEGVVMLRYRLS